MWGNVGDFAKKSPEISPSSKAALPSPMREPGTRHQHATSTVGDATVETAVMVKPGRPGEPEPEELQAFGKAVGWVRKAVASARTMGELHEVIHQISPVITSLLTSTCNGPLAAELVAKQVAWGLRHTNDRDYAEDSGTMAQLEGLRQAATECNLEQEADAADRQEITDSEIAAALKKVAIGEA